MGNSSPLVVHGKGSIEMIDGMINNVIYVPNISANFLSIYQIANFGSGKTILFTPNFVVVREIEDPSQIVSIGKVDHNARLYSFSHFVQEYPTNVLLAQ
jgi:hypothetical protein